MNTLSVKFQISYEFAEKKNVWNVPLSISSSKSRNPYLSASAILPSAEMLLHNS